MSIKDFAIVGTVVVVMGAAVIAWQTIDLSYRAARAAWKAVAR